MLSEANINIVRPYLPVCHFEDLSSKLANTVRIFLRIVSVACIPSDYIVRVHYFVRGGFVGHRSRASSKHLSPHLPVGSLDSSGSNRGCDAPEAARVGVESTKKPTPDVVVFET
ncbi:hypothetical protein TNCV_3419001 [Trichonephila clavipes]|nr:hypothetical protein TNCV_3419001 [Trichonephila clavipes]